MIIMRIKEGLGNQLFQYAAVWALSTRLKQPFMLYVDEEKEERPFRLGQLNVQVKTLVRPEELPPEFDTIMNENVNDALKKLDLAKYQFGDWLYFRQLGDEFQEDFFTVNAENIYLDGFFQCESYFKNYRADLLKQFTRFYTGGSDYKRVLEQIKNCNSVAVHVRQGDFQLSRHPFHYLLTEAYYRKAVAYIRERIKEPVFFWFSEDYEWIYDHFGHERDFFFVKTQAGSGDIDDMMLMKNCQHIVAANSTFSWWAAWLNEHGESIRIVPAKRFITEGSIPDSWTKLSL